MQLRHRVNEWLRMRRIYKHNMEIIPMLYKNRDKMLLGTPERQTVPNSINLHYWKNDNFDNLGDYLSVVIVKHFASQDDWSTDTTRHLYAVGSILGFGCQESVVWGSGVLYPYKPFLKRLQIADLDVRCVRGPLTRRILIKNGKRCPEIYGDPVLLMPMIYDSNADDKKYEVLYIPHFLDKVDEHIHSINIKTTDYQYVIDEILRSKKVISSSLHGIILAEAYGIPAVLYLPKNRNSFKYRDYYYSTGRYKFPIARSVKEALQITPCVLPELAELHENLLKTFPYDLWE